MLERPSSPRHDRAAVALANASREARGSPRTTAATSAPWKTSPAPSVLSTSTTWAGAWARSPSAVNAYDPREPSVATTTRQPCAMLAASSSSTGSDSPWRRRSASTVGT